MVTLNILYYKDCIKWTVAISIKIEMFKLKIGLPDDPVIVFISICPQEIESAHSDLTHVY